MSSLGVLSRDSRSLLLSFVALTLLACPVQAQVIFTDDFDDNSAGWVFSARSNDFFGSIASQALFGVDYSAFGIPEAPNTPAGDTATLGATLRTNVGFGDEDQAAIRLADPNFSGKYTVQVDMWLNWAADAEQIGTTEHGGLFVGTDTDADPADNTFPAQFGAGFLASTDGDCTNCDYILLKNRAELDIFSGQYSVTEFGFGNQPGFDNTDDNADPLNGAVVDFETLFPSFNVSSVVGAGQPNVPTDLEQTAGAIGFQWVTLTAVVDPTAAGDGPGPGVGTATFSITNAASGETFEIGTVDNSQIDVLDDDMDGDDCEPGENSEDICTGETPVDLEGEIALVLLDFFPSIASDFNVAFALFDNVMVFETPDGGLPGDFNGDGFVDTADFTIWRDNIGGDESSLMGNGETDGEVDIDDYFVWRNNFGASPVPPISIPEPSAVLMLACLGVAGFTRRVK